MIRGSWTRGPHAGERASWGCLWALAALLVVTGVPVAYAADEAVRISIAEETHDRIVINYLVGDYQLTPVRIDGQEYQQLSLGKEAPIKEVGSPQLPRICRSVIIPGDAKMAVNVLASQYYEIEDVAIAPSKGFIPRTTDPAQVPFTFGSVYGSDAFYPGDVAALRRPYILRNCRGTVVEFYPFQYNPVTRTLRVYSEATLEVVKVGVDTDNVLQRGGAEEEKSLAFRQVYEHHFLNYHPSLRYTPLDEEGDMLIICHDAWLSNIQPLVDHKNMIGIDTTVVGVSVIGNDATSIKNYIQSVYDSSDLAFVLLVGDGAQVDTPYASGGSSDPSYSKLAGSDDYPDIMVGRFSAETPGDVDTQVQRTIEYELMPATEQDWFWRGTGIASDQGPGDDGEYDYQHVRNIRTDLLAYGCTEVDELYDGSQGGEDASGSPTPQMVANAINAGRGIIDYCGHGSTTSWGSSGFSNGDVNALVNDNTLPFICSVACVNGQFDGYTCFAEAWLRATHNGEPTGAVAVYMSSINQSWDPPMDAEDEFVDMFVSESYSTVGTLLYAGSCHMIDQYGAGGVEMFNTWHVFGDSSLCVVGTAYRAAVLIGLPDGSPSFVNPGESTPVTVQIDDGSEGYVPGSGTLHYRFDDGAFSTSPLTSLGGNLYEAMLPAGECEATAEFYFSAAGDGGTTVYYPEDAPASVYSASVMFVTTVLSDDFEAERGWTVENDASLMSGSWERVIPSTDGSYNEPTEDYDGSGNCYVTENTFHSDVDGGPTRLISAAFDLSGSVDAALRFAWWFACDDELPPAEDYLTVEVSNDDGVSWIPVATISSAEGWVQEVIFLEEAIAPEPLTAQMRIRFGVADTPNNSKTEAGIDAVEILSLSCGESVAGDLDADGDVDLSDLAILLAAYGVSDAGDLDGDGDTDISDLAMLLANYGYGT